MKKCMSFIVIVFILVFGHRVSALNNPYEVHILDTGQSDCILIKGNEKNYMIDTGASWTSNKVIDYLKIHGISKLDKIIITHYHDDHYGGLESLLKTIKVDEVILPTHQSSYRDFIFSYLRNYSIKIDYITDNFEIKDKNIDLKAVPVKKEDKAIENNNGRVLAGTINGIKYAFMADVEKEREKEILNNELLVNSQVIKVPHHALDTSSTEALIKFIKPKIAVITCDGNESPNKEVINRYEECKAVIFRTDMHGDIVIKANPENKDIEITSTKVIK